LFIRERVRGGLKWLQKKKKDLLNNNRSQKVRLGEEKR
jgi:hypothetical protein